MNKAILLGRLTKDPELNQTSNGVSYCNFSIAVSRRFADANGEKQADFINIVAWRTNAENCAKYLKKGSQVSIIGSIQTRTYEAQDGSKRNIFEIVADEVEFVGTKSSNGVQDEPIEKPKVSKLEAVSDNNDDLPF